MYWRHYYTKWFCVRQPSRTKFFQVETELQIDGSCGKLRLAYEARWLGALSCDFLHEHFLKQHEAKLTNAWRILDCLSGWLNQSFETFERLKLCKLSHPLMSRSLLDPQANQIGFGDGSVQEVQEKETKNHVAKRQPRPAIPRRQKTRLFKSTWTFGFLHLPEKSRAGAHKACVCVWRSWG